MRQIAEELRWRDIFPQTTAGNWAKQPTQRPAAAIYSPERRSMLKLPLS